MKVLRQIHSFGLILLLIIGLGVRAKAQSSPLLLRVVNAPEVLIAGQSHVFTIEVQNATDEPITFSLLPGFRWELSWLKGKKLDGGTAGNNNSKADTATGINPQTGEFICLQSNSEASDFVTLQPNESRDFEIVVKVPEYLKVKKAVICFSLDSACTGKDLGMVAWTGATKTFCAESRVLRRKHNN